MPKNLAILAIALLAATAASAAELQRLDGVVLVGSRGNDGDSFRILHQGREFNLRLYYVDCPESQATTTSDASRLREQTRYFGLPNANRTLHYGQQASAFTQKKLAKPFTVHTAYATAPGRSREGRIYGFVITGDGQNLATLLVKNGYARSHGVRRALPDGTHRDEVTARLDDQETVAILTRKGIWSETNPGRLVELRADARLEEAELQALLSPSTAGSININTATAKELQSIKGVGPVTAGRIIDLRPFSAPKDLLRIPRLPAATRSNIVARVTFQ